MAQTPEPGDHVGAHAPEPRLDSWKAIAVYLNRDVSTVRRWERREGLPVHRHLHHKLGSVYAFPSEIDRWWGSRHVGLDRAGRGEELAAQRPSAGPLPPTSAEKRESERHPPAVWVKRGLLAASLAVLVVTIQIGAPRAPRIADAGASVAVLPFQHVAVNDDADILVDGLTEGIINSLSAASHLKVISSASVFRYKGKSIHSRQAGRDLGVRAVLLGRVTQLNGRLTLAVELVDARDDRQLWGQTYERGAANLGLLHEEIARHVTRTLTGREPAGFTSRYRQNAAAYELYLRGRYHWNKRTPEDFRRAVNEFSQIIEKDPAYAPAYAGLADSYTLMAYFYNLIPFDEARVKARAAAAKALELDESLAEAHMSMAGVLEFEQWDWAGAEREYRRAIELSPNYASAYHWYANNLSIRGRHDEAIAQGTRAAELDPLSPIVHVALGHAYYLADRHDEAIGQFQRALEIEPSFANAHQMLGQAYARKGLYEEAVAEFRKADTAGRWLWKSALAHVYTRMGRHDAAGQIVRTFKSRRPEVSLVTVAALFAAVGERDEPLALLTQAIDQGDPDISFIKSLLAFESLRGDRAFQALLRRIGLG
jgi:TolB-like protein/Flp pilus assembly protein TadD